MEHLQKWTMPRDYMGESWPEYYTSGCGQSRDSKAWERSNFACMLKALGGESETVLVIREGHWAVGWVEWIAIHESDTRALEIADKIAGELKDYPIIDEEHWSNEEQDEATQVWKDCYDKFERLEYIRRNRSQFDFNDYADLYATVRGEYFGGYAGELLG